MNVVRVEGGSLVSGVMALPPTRNSPKSLAACQQRVRLGGDNLEPRLHVLDVSGATTAESSGEAVAVAVAVAVPAAVGNKQQYLDRERMKPVKQAGHAAKNVQTGRMNAQRSSKHRMKEVGLYRSAHLWWLRVWV